METDLGKILERGELNSYNEIVDWWNKGRPLFNLIFLFVVFVHFFIMFFYFKNGYAVLLFPLVFILWIKVNIIFSIGLVVELIVKYILRPKASFNDAASIIKTISFAGSIGYVIVLSARFVFGNSDY